MQTLILDRSAPVSRPIQQSSAPAQAAPSDRHGVAEHYLGCLAQRHARERERAATFFHHMPTR